MSDAPRALVEAYESSIDPERRRRTGAHYTPETVARRVVDLAFGAFGGSPGSVCDPTCGAGSFLLAAADALFEAGVPAREVVEARLVGVELDPAAAGVARAAIARWAEDHGARGAATARIDVGDSLLRERTHWPGRPIDGYDVVVGNPPFLGQLSARTARGRADRERIAARWGLRTGYADTAALFLLASVELVRDGGVVALLQPQSVLSARDTGPIRDALLHTAHLHALWATDERVFDAAVRVCAPVLRTFAGAVRPPGHRPDGVHVWWRDRPMSTAHDVPRTGTSWGPLLATAHGIPTVELDPGTSVGDVASATAGFRDEYYALRDACVDEVDGAGPPLVTVGMVEPGWSRWGSPRRFGGVDRTAPRLDPTELERRSPKVARWARARQVPKVLVATQTRVVEALADPDGVAVPVTPLISVEPHDRTEVWRLTAALLAPPVSAVALANHLGSAMSGDALRWSASSVLTLPLPSRDAAWEQGAELCRQLAGCEPGRRPQLLQELGATMCDAYGDDAATTLAWWLERAVRS